MAGTGRHHRLPAKARRRRRERAVAGAGIHDDTLRTMPAEAFQKLGGQKSRYDMEAAVPGRGRSRKQVASCSPAEQ